MALSSDATELDGESSPSAPLLQLPAELRCQIFDLVLDDERYMHVGELGHSLRGYHTSVHACLDPPKPCISDHLIPPAPWSRRHARCMQSQASSVFGLPLVCKTFHHDLARHLLNTTIFIFADRVYLENFLARLKPWQRDQIRHIVLCCTSTRQPWRLPLHDITLSRLTGLRKLTIYVEVTQEDLGPYRSDNSITREGQDGRLGGLVRFHWLRLAECEMIVVQPWYLEGTVRTMIPDYVEAAWVKRMRRRILGDRRDSVVAKVQSEEEDGLTAKPGMII